MERKPSSPVPGEQNQQKASRNSKPHINSLQCFFKSLGLKTHRGVGWEDNAQLTGVWGTLKLNINLSSSFSSFLSFLEEQQNQSKPDLPHGTHTLGTCPHLPRPTWAPKHSPGTPQNPPPVPRGHLGTGTGQSKSSV